MYCFFDEENQIAICYFPDKICTYYPDGSVECVPIASRAQWVTPMVALIVIIVAVLLGFGLRLGTPWPWQ